MQIMATLIVLKLEGVTLKKPYRVLIKGIGEVASKIKVKQINDSLNKDMTMTVCNSDYWARKNSRALTGSLLKPMFKYADVSLGEISNNSCRTVQITQILL